MRSVRDVVWTVLDLIGSAFRRLFRFFVGPRHVEDTADREVREYRQLRGYTATGWLTWLALVTILTLAVTSCGKAYFKREIKIEPFEVPAELEQRGYNGRVVASRILDELNRIRNPNLGCTSIWPGEDSAQIEFSGSWSPKLDVEIPSTGFSLGDFEEMLRGWFGTTQTLSGEVTVPSSGNATVTIRRSDGFSHALLPRGIDEVDDGFRRAAWAIVANDDPLILAQYLGQYPAHRDLARRVLERLANSTEPEERKWGRYARSVRLWREARYREVADDLREAIRIDPAMGDAHFNYGVLALRLGDEEQALQSFRRAEANISDEVCAPTGEARLRRMDMLAEIAFLLKDADGAQQSLRPGDEPYVRVLRHDPARARPEATGDLRDRVDAAELALEEEMSLGSERVAEAARALAEASIARTRASNSADATEAVFEARRKMLPLAALGFASANQLDRARQLLERSNPVSYRTKIAWGAVEAASGNLAQARSWFDRARAQAPSIADADQEFGVVLLRAGRIDEALSAFNRAHERAPRWADPLKGLGDALARKGRYAEAVEKYSAAARIAPRWAMLHIALARTLWASGRRREAIITLRRAAAMQISARDAETIRWLSRNAGQPIL